MEEAVLWEALSGLLLGITIGWAGYRLGSFSRSGAVGVVAIAVLSFALGGWVWGAIPLVYLLGSSLWSRYATGRKAGLFDRPEKGYRRNWIQVVATTAWAGVLVLLQRFTPERTGVFAAYVGAIATVNADAWATDLGLLSSRPPRLITTRRRVPPGTPGGISALGSAATFAGAWLIGFVGLLLTVISASMSEDEVWDRTLLWLPLSATAAALAGCLVDSLLGATAQGVYFCERCQEYCERRTHSCGEEAQQVRGWSWLTNEGVDFVSSVVGGAAAAVVIAWLASAKV